MDIHAGYYSSDYTNPWVYQSSPGGLRYREPTSSHVNRGFRHNKTEDIIHEINRLKQENAELALQSWNIKEDISSHEGDILDELNSLRLLNMKLKLSTSKPNRKETADVTNTKAQVDAGISFTSTATKEYNGIPPRKRYSEPLGHEKLGDAISTQDIFDRVDKLEANVKKVIRKYCRPKRHQYRETTTAFHQHTVSHSSCGGIAGSDFYPIKETMKKSHRHTATYIRHSSIPTTTSDRVGHERDFEAEAKRIVAEYHKSKERLKYEICRGSQNHSSDDKRISLPHEHVQMVSLRHDGDQRLDVGYHTSMTRGSQPNTYLPSQQDQHNIQSMGNAEERQSKRESKQYNFHSKVSSIDTYRSDYTDKHTAKHDQPGNYASRNFQHIDEPIRKPKVRLNEERQSESEDTNTNSSRGQADNDRMLLILRPTLSVSGTVIGYDVAEDIPENNTVAEMGLQERQVAENHDFTEPRKTFPYVLQNEPHKVKALVPLPNSFADMCAAPGKDFTKRDLAEGSKDAEKCTKQEIEIKIPFKLKLSRTPEGSSLSDDSQPNSVSSTLGYDKDTAANDTADNQLLSVQICDEHVVSLPEDYLERSVPVIRVYDEDTELVTTVEQCHNKLKDGASTTHVIPVIKREGQCGQVFGGNMEQVEHNEEKKYRRALDTEVENNDSTTPIGVGESSVTSGTVELTVNPATITPVCGFEQDPVTKENDTSLIIQEGDMSTDSTTEEETDEGPTFTPVLDFVLDSVSDEETDERPTVSPACQLGITSVTDKDAVSNLAVNTVGNDKEVEEHPEITPVLDFVVESETDEESVTVSLTGEEPDFHATDCKVTQISDKAKDKSECWGNYKEISDTRQMHEIKGIMMKDPVGFPLTFQENSSNFGFPEADHGDFIPAADVEMTPVSRFYVSDSDSSCIDWSDEKKPSTAAVENKIKSGEKEGSDLEENHPGMTANSKTVVEKMSAYSDWDSGDDGEGKTTLTKDVKDILQLHESHKRWASSSKYDVTEENTTFVVKPVKENSGNKRHDRERDSTSSPGKPTGEDNVLDLVLASGYDWDSDNSEISLKEDSNSEGNRNCCQNPKTGIYPQNEGIPELALTGKKTYTVADENRSPGGSNSDWDRDTGLLFEEKNKNAVKLSSAVNNHTESSQLAAQDITEEKPTSGVHKSDPEESAPVVNTTFSHNNPALKEAELSIVRNANAESDWDSDESQKSSIHAVECNNGKGGKVSNINGSSAKAAEKIDTVRNMDSDSDWDNDESENSTTGVNNDFVDVPDICRNRVVNKHTEDEGNPHPPLNEDMVANETCAVTNHSPGSDSDWDSDVGSLLEEPVKESTEKHQPDISLAGDTHTDSTPIADHDVTKGDLGSTPPVVPEITDPGESGHVLESPEDTASRKELDVDLNSDSDWDSNEPEEHPDNVTKGESTENIEKNNIPSEGRGSANVKNEIDFSNDGIKSETLETQTGGHAHDQDIQGKHSEKEGHSTGSDSDWDSDVGSLLDDLDEEKKKSTKPKPLSTCDNHPKPAPIAESDIPEGNSTPIVPMASDILDPGESDHGFNVTSHEKSGGDVELDVVQNLKSDSDWDSDESEENTENITKGAGSENIEKNNIPSDETGSANVKGGKGFSDDDIKSETHETQTGGHAHDQDIHRIHSENEGHSSGSDSDWDSDVGSLLDDFDEEHKKLTKPDPLSTSDNHTNPAPIAESDITKDNSTFIVPMASDILDPGESGQRFNVASHEKSGEKVELDIVQNLNSDSDWDSDESKEHTDNITKCESTDNIEKNNIPSEGIGSANVKSEIDLSDDGIKSETPETQTETQTDQRNSENDKKIPSYVAKGTEHLPLTAGGHDPRENEGHPSVSDSDWDSDVGLLLDDLDEEKKKTTKPDPLSTSDSHTKPASIAESDKPKGNSTPIFPMASDILNPGESDHGFNVTSHDKFGGEAELDVVQNLNSDSDWDSDESKKSTNDANRRSPTNSHTFQQNATRLNYDLKKPTVTSEIIEKGQPPESDSDWDSDVGSLLDKFDMESKKAVQSDLPLVRDNNSKSVASPYATTQMETTSVSKVTEMFDPEKPVQVVNNYFLRELDAAKESDSASDWDSEKSDKHTGDVSIGNQFGKTKVPSEGTGLPGGETGHYVSGVEIGSTPAEKETGIQTEYHIHKLETNAVKGHSYLELGSSCLGNVQDKQVITNETAGESDSQESDSDWDGDIGSLLDELDVESKKIVKPEQSLIRNIHTKLKHTSSPDIASENNASAVSMVSDIFDPGKSSHGLNGKFSRDKDRGTDEFDILQNLDSDSDWEINEPKKHTHDVAKNDSSPSKDTLISQEHQESQRATVVTNIENKASMLNKMLSSKEPVRKDIEEIKAELDELLDAALDTDSDWSIAGESGSEEEKKFSSSTLQIETSTSRANETEVLEVIKDFEEETSPAVPNVISISDNKLSVTNDDGKQAARQSREQNASSKDDWLDMLEDIDSDDSWNSGSSGGEYGSEENQNSRMFMEKNAQSDDDTPIPQENKKSQLDTNIEKKVSMLNKMLSAKEPIRKDIDELKAELDELLDAELDTDSDWSIAGESGSEEEKKFNSFDENGLTPQETSTSCARERKVLEKFIGDVKEETSPAVPHVTSIADNKLPVSNDDGKRNLRQSCEQNTSSKDDLLDILEDFISDGDWNSSDSDKEENQNKMYTGKDAQSSDDDFLADLKSVCDTGGKVSPKATVTSPDTLDDVKTGSALSKPKYNNSTPGRYETKTLPKDSMKSTSAAGRDSDVDDSDDLKDIETLLDGMSTYWSDKKKQSTDIAVSDRKENPPENKSAVHNEDGKRTIRQSCEKNASSKDDMLDMLEDFDSDWNSGDSDEECGSEKGKDAPSSDDDFLADLKPCDAGGAVLSKATVVSTLGDLKQGSAPSKPKYIITPSRYEAKTLHKDSVKSKSTAGRDSDVNDSDDLGDIETLLDGFDDKPTSWPDKEKQLSDIAVEKASPGIGLSVHNDDRNDRQSCGQKASPKDDLLDMLEDFDSDIDWDSDEGSGSKETQKKSACDGKDPQSVNGITSGNTEILENRGNILLKSHLVGTEIRKDMPPLKQLNLSDKSVAKGEYDEIGGSQTDTKEGVSLCEVFEFSYSDSDNESIGFNEAKKETDMAYEDEELNIMADVLSSDVCVQTGTKQDQLQESGSSSCTYDTSSDEEERARGHHALEKAELVSTTNVHKLMYGQGGISKTPFSNVLSNAGYCDVVYDEDELDIMNDVMSFSGDVVDTHQRKHEPGCHGHNYETLSGEEERTSSQLKVEKEEFAVTTNVHKMMFDRSGIENRVPDFSDMDYDDYDLDLNCSDICDTEIGAQTRNINPAAPGVTSRHSDSKSFRPGECEDVGTSDDKNDNTPVIRLSEGANRLRNDYSLSSNGDFQSYSYESSTDEDTRNSKTYADIARRKATYNSDGCFSNVDQESATADFRGYTYETSSDEEMRVQSKLKAKEPLSNDGNSMTFPSERDSNRGFRDTAKSTDKVGTNEDSSTRSKDVSLPCINRREDISRRRNHSISSGDFLDNSSSDESALSEQRDVDSVDTITSEEYLDQGKVNKDLLQMPTEEKRTSMSIKDVVYSPILVPDDEEETDCGLTTENSMKTAMMLNFMQIVMEDKGAASEDPYTNLNESNNSRGHDRSPRPDSVEQGNYSGTGATDQDPSCLSTTDTESGLLHEVKKPTRMADNVQIPHEHGHYGSHQPFLQQKDNRKDAKQYGNNTSESDEPIHQYTTCVEHKHTYFTAKYLSKKEIADENLHQSNDAIMSTQRRKRVPYSNGVVMDTQRREGVTQSNGVVNDTLKKEVPQFDCDVKVIQLGEEKVTLDRKLVLKSNDDTIVVQLSEEIPRPNGVDKVTEGKLHRERQFTAKYLNRRQNDKVIDNTCSPCPKETPAPVGLESVPPEPKPKTYRSRQFTDKYLLTQQVQIHPRQAKHPQKEFFAQSNNDTMSNHIKDQSNRTVDGGSRYYTAKYLTTRRNNADVDERTINQNAIRWPEEPPSCGMSDSSTIAANSHMNNTLRRETSVGVNVDTLRKNSVIRETSVGVNVDTLRKDSVIHGTSVGVNGDTLRKDSVIHGTSVGVNVDTLRKDSVIHETSVGVNVDTLRKDSVIRETSVGVNVDTLRKDSVIHETSVGVNVDTLRKDSVIHGTSVGVNVDTLRKDSVIHGTSVGVNGDTLRKDSVIHGTFVGVNVDTLRKDSVIRETSVGVNVDTLRKDSVIRETSVGVNVDTLRKDSVIHGTSVGVNVDTLRKDSVIHETSRIPIDVYYRRGISLNGCRNIGS